MTRDHAIQGLYAVTRPSAAAARPLPELVAAALAGGARMIQYRDKGPDQARRRQEAEAIAELCRRHGALFIVNDDVELAAACAADGVHLGRDDAGLQAARGRLGPDAVIGISCYDSLAWALDAQRAGAGYVAFGSLYPSPTKPAAPRASLGLLGRARARLSIPVVAIGGIDETNAAAAVAAGADAVAVISALFDATDVGGAARRLADRIERARFDVAAAKSKDDARTRE